MHAGQYGEVEHERHLNGLCSYPLCENAPSAPYRAHKRFQISARAKTIKEVEGNADEGFCSKRCRVKSQWVRENLGSEAAWLRGKVAPLELLDDMEERGELVWDGGKNGQYRRVKPAAGADGMDVGGTGAAGNINADNRDKSGSAASAATAAETNRPPPSVSDRAEIDVQDHAPRGAGSAALPRDSEGDKVPVVSSLSRPPTTTTGQQPSLRHAAAAQPSPPHATSAARAPPPSAGSAGTGSGSGSTGAGTGGVAGTTTAGTPIAAAATVSGDEGGAEVHDLLDSLVIRERDTKADVPVPPTLNPPPAQLVPKPPTASAARKARNTSSMIDGTNSKLAQSVLTAHRQMKPVLQDEGESSEEEGYEEPEWEREMGWGEGAELDAMFEEARKARELAGDT